MADAPYRDELAAAHQRIAALEAELARARSGDSPGRGPSHPALEEHLLPGEVVIWVGAPDPRQSVIKPRHLWFMGAWAFFLFWLVVGMMRGMPPAFSVPAGSFLALMGTVVGIRRIQALRDAQGTVYALTDRRVLLLHQLHGEVTVRGIHLEPELSATLTLRAGGLGDLFLSPPNGESARMVSFPEAARAHRLLGEALTRQRTLAHKATDPSS